MEAKDLVGWLSSAILLMTVGRQIYKQWQEGSSEGVSKGLFVGQMAASFGLAAYSWMVRNWVFVATNLLMLLSGVIGYGITLHHQRNAKRSADS
ncbi:MAG: hypothetical protein JO316_24605 [Abitibacteriaceae bacterium]|nr:hypothetical protein [Abditibacteriaceae bacterium]